MPSSAVSLPFGALKEEEIKQEMRLLQALHDEFDTVWARYFKTLGCLLEAVPEGGALTSHFPISSDYFPVYKGNTASIGSIQNKEIRRGIVSVYTQGSGMIDSYLLNNDLIADWLEKDTAFALSGSDQDKVRAQDAYDGLIFYANQLKTGHNELKAELTVLLAKIQTELVRESR